MTEFGHRSAVSAGENQGATLAYEFVVREFRAIDTWPAPRGVVRELSYSPGGVPDAAHPRRVNLVVVDAATGRPVQALALDC